MSFENLSAYARQLGKDEQTRYTTKIKDLGGIDPYVLDTKSFVLSLDELPRITSEALTDFLIFRVSPHAQSDIRAYKSLNAFAQFACKWIEDIKAIKISDCFCIVGKVMHSQRVSESSLKIWLTVTNNGEILNCHCTCVAGLGEACTHIAAILFALEYAGKQQQSVTDTLAYWVGPKSKKVLHKKIVDIDFNLPQALLRPTCSNEEVLSVPTEAVPELSDDDVQEFLAAYRTEGTLCVLHNLFEEPKTGEWPYLTELFIEQLKNRSLVELQEIGENTSINISQEVITNAEQETRKQAKSKLWFLLRAGRITASNFHAVCATSVSKPSLSLLKRICYPHLHKAVFRAGIYGCQHEADALETFLAIHRRTHNCSLTRCGLLLSSEYPWCAATPDGFLNCEECGMCTYR